MTTYNILGLDVWGNTREGFDVNQTYRTGRTLTLSGTESDRTINRRLGLRGLKWEGDPEFMLYGENKRNGRPAIYLAAIEE